MKKTRKLISICIVLAMVLCFGFAGCDSNAGGNTATPDQVTDLQFNIETGEFSFSDVNAEEYKVRIFPAELAEGEADMPITQQVVRDTDKASYTGALDLTDLEAGRQYKAVVYSFIENEDGTLSEAVSEAVLGVCKKAYPTVTKTTAGYSGTYLDGEITISMSGNFFSGDYGKCAPTFEISLYKGDELIETKVMTDNDFDVTVEEGVNECGQATTTVTGGIELKYTMDDPEATYFVTVKVISTDSVAYYDSEVSEKMEVTLYDENANQDTGEGSGS